MQNTDGFSSLLADLLSAWFKKRLISPRTFSFFQRLKYQYTDCHFGKHEGKFRHWQPVRTIYSSASIIVRKSCRLFRFKFKNLEIALHWGSVSRLYCLINSLMFGHCKDGTIPILRNSQTHSKRVWRQTKFVRISFNQMRS